MKKFLPFLIAIILFASACAPRAVIRPAPKAAAIPPDTPPAQVFSLIKSADEKVQSLKAAVTITVDAGAKGKKSFDGVLYAMKPDDARLTGLALLGVTVFDAVLKGDKFYFYRPSEGILYTGPRASLRRFLKEQGVDVDPEVVARSLFMASGGPEDYLLEGTGGEGYSLTLLNKGLAPVLPSMQAEYDQALDLKERIFYDELARPYLFVHAEGEVEESGARLPQRIIAKDVRGGYTVTVDFEKYIVNPPGIENEFSIEGGELKGIRQVE